MVYWIVFTERLIVLMLRVHENIGKFEGGLPLVGVLIQIFNRGEDTAPTNPSFKMRHQIHPICAAEHWKV